MTNTGKIHWHRTECVTNIQLINGTYTFTARIYYSIEIVPYLFDQYSNSLTCSCFNKLNAMALSAEEVRVTVREEDTRSSNVFDIERSALIDITCVKATSLAYLIGNMRSSRT